jgi:hypothetical protein
MSKKDETTGGHRHEPLPSLPSRHNRRVGLTTDLPEEWIEAMRRCAESTEAQKLTLTERDSLRVLDLLENPPEPAARLLRAAKALKQGN